MTAMRTLLLQLPLSAASAAASYGVAELDLGGHAARVTPSQAPLALLPRGSRGSEVVAMVPAAALSWHRVTVPAGLQRSPKLQAALQGLLEDRLLQAPHELHLALAPQWRAGSPCWVAACDKAWLQSHLQALHSAGLGVQRIVPELAPASGTRLCHALGDPSDGWLWCLDAEHGVSGWPVSAAAQLPAAWCSNAQWQTEPGLASWAQAQDGPAVQLVDTAAHWAQAAGGAWNLAQFDLQSDARSRRWQSLRRGLDTVLRHPQWRPARWGLLALLISQLLGLQAWAWMTRQQWQAEQAHWTQILQDTFPKVTLVVDAPLQMARELARLRQASGQLGPSDFEAQLQALGQALPAGMRSPTQLDYQNDQLQWPSLSLSAAQQAAFEQALQGLGYRLSSEAGQQRLQAMEAQP